MRAFFCRHPCEDLVGVALGDPIIRLVLMAFMFPIAWRVLRKFG